MAEIRSGVMAYRPVVRWSQYRVIIGLAAWLGFALLAGCSGMPSLAEQEQEVRDNNLVLRKLEPRAFVRAWGKPTYQHTEFTPFFVLKDGSLMPNSRIQPGEPPKEWEAMIDAGEGLFLAYPDHGWLVVFLDEVFVYREALSAEKLHEIGRTWQHEDKFRTRLDSSPTP